MLSVRDYTDGLTLLHLCFSLLGGLPGLKCNYTRGHSYRSATMGSTRIARRAGI